MTGSRRNAEVTQGVVLPIVALVVVFVAGLVTGQQALYIALMAAVPLLSAVFASVAFTAVVAVVTFVAAVVLAFVPGDGDFASSVPSLIGVIVFGAIAVIASRFRGADAAASAAPMQARKGVQFQLQTQADSDSMTGLLNRRGAIRALGPRNTAGDRVVAFLDCDLFKSVNEQYGSEVGDEFLQAIAGRLRHSLPPHDTVARWDGDEFLLAISTDPALARQALERVMKSINAHPIRTTAGPIPASVSVGAALWGTSQELEDVISRAGRALYSAKSSGRGQVVVDGEGVRAPEPAADTSREGE